MSKILRLYTEGLDGTEVKASVDRDTLIKLHEIFRYKENFLNLNDCKVFRQDVALTLELTFPESQTINSLHDNIVLKTTLAVLIYDWEATEQIFKLGKVINSVDANTGICIETAAPSDHQKVAFGRSITQARDAYYDVIDPDHEEVWN